MLESTYSPPASPVKSIALGSERQNTIWKILRGCQSYSLAHEERSSQESPNMSFRPALAGNPGNEFWTPACAGVTRTSELDRRERQDHVPLYRAGLRGPDLRGAGIFGSPPVAGCAQLGQGLPCPTVETQRVIEHGFAMHELFQLTRHGGLLRAALGDELMSSATEE